MTAPTITLFAYLLKVLRRLPGTLALGLGVRLLIAAPFALAALLLHTYLLVVVNEGFGEGGTIWNQVLALQGARWVTGTALWGLVAFVVTALVTRALSRGPIRFTREILGVPGFIATSAARGGAAGVAILAGAYAVGEYAGTWLGSRPMGLALLAGAWLALAAGPNGAFVTILRLAWADAERVLFSGYPRHAFAPEPLVLLQVGLAFGVGRSSVLPFQPGYGMASGYTLGVVALVLLALSVRRGALLAALLAVAWFGSSDLAWADDGGWVEGGGTFIDWIRSDGAIPAILHGLPPAVATLVGVVLGSFPGLFPPLDGLVPEVTTGVEEPVDETPHDVPVDTIEVPPLVPFQWVGGPGDKPFTQHHGGQGPGRCGVGMPNWWVDTSTRALFVRDVLFSLDAPGPSLELALTWSGASTPPGLVGRGWRTSWDLVLAERDGNGVLWLASGRVTRVVDGVADRGRFVVRRDGAVRRVDDRDAHRTYVFARSGRLDRVEDAFGNALVIERDDRERVRRVVDAAGRAVAVTTDDAGLMTALSLPDGRRATFAYKDGFLAEVVDLAGIPTRYGYQGGAVVRLAVSDPPHVAQIAYAKAGPDALPPVTEFVQPDGVRLRYRSVDGAVEVEGTGGDTWRYESQEGRTTAVVDPEGRRTAHTYDARGNRVATVRGGGTWRMEWDDRGRPTALEDPRGHRFATRWDDAGDRVEDVLQDGSKWSYRWDRHTLVAVDGPDGHTTKFHLDARGLAVARTDALGRTHRWTRDERGNVVALAGPEGTRLRIEWDPAGVRPVAWTDAAGRRTTLAMDGNDRLLRAVGPAGNEDRMDHSCCGPTTRTDAIGRTERFGRDDMGRLVEWVGPTGLPVSFSWDARGDLVGLTDPSGATTRLDRDRAGRITGVTGPDGAPLVRLALDACGRAVALTDGAGATSRVVRDAAGLVDEEIDPQGRVVSWSYDSRGRPVRRARVRGGSVAWAWDVRDRLVSVTHGTERVARFEYDADGRLLLTEDPLGATRLTWDEGDRLLGIRWSDTLALSIEHDATGRVARRRLPGGLEVTITRDPLTDLPVRIAFGGHHVELRYDAVRRLVGVRRSNGVATDVTWSPRDLVERLRHVGPTGPFFAQEVAYDRTGRPIEVSGEAPLAPPIDARTGRLEADPAGQITRTEGGAFAWDASGNRVSGPGFQARYDAGGRLVEVRRGTEVLRLGYDALGRLATEDRDGVRRRLLYDLAGRLVAEVDDAGKAIASYVHVERLPIARVGADGSVAFYHYDAWLRTIALTAADGTLCGAYGWDPWGRGVAQVDAPYERQPFTWLGGVGIRDLGGGLFHMGARAYDAHTATFLQRDPIGLSAGQHPYQYVWGSPLAGIDPSGTDPVLAFLGFSAFVALAAWGLNKKFDSRTDTTSPFHQANVTMNAVTNPTPENRAAAQEVIKNVDPNATVRWAVSVPQSIGEKVVNVTPLEFGVAAIKTHQAIQSGDGVKVLLEAAGGMPLTPLVKPELGDAAEVVEQWIDATGEAYDQNPRVVGCQAPTAGGK